MLPVRKGKPEMSIRKLMFEIVKREHPITVRGCFYRAVSAGIYPGTQDHFYQKCVKLLQDMRAVEPVLRLGQIPYEWIVDSSRSREGSGGYESLDSYISDIPKKYGRNLWKDQDTHVEVMTEKDAMATILKPIVRKWNVPFTVFRGNPSDTMCYNLGNLFKGNGEEGEDMFGGMSGLLEMAGLAPPEKVVVLYLGDFDPSGLNISRVARRKIESFAERKIEWQRVAINTKQFERMRGQFGIPVKGGDNLAPEYVKRYGKQCVEVDAIPSNEVRALLDTAIVKHVDMETWKESLEIERGEQLRLKRLVSKMK